MKNNDVLDKALKKFYLAYKLRKDGKSTKLIIKNIKQGIQHYHTYQSQNEINNILSNGQSPIELLNNNKQAEDIVQDRSKRTTVTNRNAGKKKKKRRLTQKK